MPAQRALHPTEKGGEDIGLLAGKLLRPSGAPQERPLHAVRCVDGGTADLLGVHVDAIASDVPERVCQLGETVVHGEDSLALVRGQYVRRLRLGWQRRVRLLVVRVSNEWTLPKVGHAAGQPGRIVAMPQIAPMLCRYLLARIMEVCGALGHPLLLPGLLAGE